MKTQQQTLAWTCFKLPRNTRFWAGYGTCTFVAEERLHGAPPVPGPYKLKPRHVSCLSKLPGRAILPYKPPKKGHSVGLFVARPGRGLSHGRREEICQSSTSARLARQQFHLRHSYAALRTLLQHCLAFYPVARGCHHSSTMMFHVHKPWRLFATTKRARNIVARAMVSLKPPFLTWRDIRFAELSSDFGKDRFDLCPPPPPSG